MSSPKKAIQIVSSPKIVGVYPSIYDKLIDPKHFFLQREQVFVEIPDTFFEFPNLIQSLFLTNTGGIYSFLLEGVK